MIVDMVFCVKCGFEITEESSKFCPKCGTNVFQHSKTDSKVNSVSAKPITSPSKRSNKKIIMISVILSLIAVFIIVPFLIGSIDQFPKKLGEYYREQNNERKIIECNEKQETLYKDIYGKICCTSETIMLHPADGLRCPLKP
ncbi:MAG: zinc-ribbon domain-containing protein [Nitrosopumilus sp.]|nr:zinc-ribbon domain-containing protein [Nitrosopumilus sp.]